MSVFNWISDLTGLHAIRESLPGAVDDSEVVLDVPGYRQVDSYSCGAIAGYSVVATFAPHISFDQFHAAVSPDRTEGVSMDELVRVLRKFGVGVKTVKGCLTFRQIRNAIDQGFPIIVGRLTEHLQDHWVVIYGYGLDPERVFLVNRSANPFFGPIMKWQKFLPSYLAVDGPSLICWGK